MAETNLSAPIYSRNIFSPEEADLYELSQLAGVTLDPNVFKIIVDLLKMNTHPTAIVQVLKKMSLGSSTGRRRVRGNSGSSDGSRRGTSDKSPSGASLGSGDQARSRLPPQQRSSSTSSLSQLPSGHSSRAQAGSQSTVTVNGGRGT